MKQKSSEKERGEVARIEELLKNTVSEKNAKGFVKELKDRMKSKGIALSSKTKAIEPKPEPKPDISGKTFTSPSSYWEGRVPTAPITAEMQEEALIRYINNGYASINQRLRKEERSSDPFWDNAAMALESKIDSSRVGAKTLYRGISVTANIDKNMFQVGAEIVAQGRK